MLYLLHCLFSIIYVYIYKWGVLRKQIIVSIESEDLASATEGPLAQDLFPYLL